jgi:hypothetical protein
MLSKLKTYCKNWCNLRIKVSYRYGFLGKESPFFDCYHSVRWQHLTRQMAAPDGYKYLRHHQIGLHFDLTRRQDYYFLGQLLSAMSGRRR